MITLHSTEANDVTVLSNVFIDRFMPRAGGEFVKVYIYLLRMLGSPQEAFGLSQMADSLLCTEGDILRALKYWENEKLVSLIYEGNALTGITLLTPRNKADEISVNAEQDFPVQENPLSNLENAAAVSSQDTAFPSLTELDPSSSFTRSFQAPFREQASYPGPGEGAEAERRYCPAALHCRSSIWARPLPLRRPARSCFSMMSCICLWILLII